MSIAGLVLFGLATEGWMVYAIIPFTGLGALITPAMTALMSRRVPADAQGELQGALSGVLAVTLIISPVLMTQTFGYFTSAGAPVYLPGAPFLAAAALMALALVPFSFGGAAHLGLTAGARVPRCDAVHPRPCGTPGAIIGEIAASVLGRPRLTVDIDVLVLLEREEWPEFLAAGREFGRFH